MSGTSGSRHRRGLREAREDLAADTRAAGPARPRRPRHPDAGSAAAPLRQKARRARRPAGARRRARPAPRARPRARPGVPRPRPRRRRRRRVRAAAGWPSQAAAQHDRVGSPRCCGVQRHAGQVEHLEDVGVGQLVLQGEAPERCVAHGAPLSRLHSGTPRARMSAGHVGPGAVGAFGRRRRSVVYAGIEDLQPGVGDPDLVDVRVRQHDPRRGAGLVADVDSPPT